MPDHSAHYHNRMRWDETVATHVKSRLYRVPRVIAGRAALSSLERSALGRAPDDVCLHAMCHIGTDTVLAGRLFGTVIGVDYSAVAVAAARRIAGEARAHNVSFATGDVGALPVRADSVDTVFLNWGSLIWIFDPAAVFAEFARVLRPGGRLVIVDQHPVALAFGRGGPNGVGTVPAAAYFGPPVVRLDRDDYAERGTSFRHATVTEARHTVGRLVESLSERFTIRRFSEHPLLGWPAFNGMTRIEDRLWELPGTPIPLSLVMVAQAR